MFLTSVATGKICDARALTFRHTLERVPDSAYLRVVAHDCSALPQFDLIYLGLDAAVFLWLNPEPGKTVHFSLKAAIAHSSVDGPETGAGTVTIDNSVTAAVGRSSIFDVRQFGAKGLAAGHPPIDDTLAVRRALAAAEAAGGGEVVFPTGTFCLCVQETTRGLAEAALWIGSSNITLRGAGMGQTILKFYAPGMKSPIDAWEVYATAGLPSWQPGTSYTAAARVVHGGEEYQVTSLGTHVSGVVGPSGRFPGDFVDGTDGLTWRYASHMYVGGAIRINQRVHQNVEWIRRIRLADMTLDGQTGWPDAAYDLTQNQEVIWTAGGYQEVTTGQAFDASNEAVRIDGNLIDGVTLERVEVTGFRAEGFYYGGSTLYGVHIKECFFHNTIGSMISATGELLIEDTRLSHSGNAFECFHRVQPITVLRCHVSDVLVGYSDGGNMDLTDGPWGKLTIADCVFESCYRRGIFCVGYSENIEIRNNDMRDCGITSEDQEFIRLSSFWGPVRDALVTGNRMYASGKECKTGITAIGDVRDCEISNNLVGQTNRGRALSHFVQWPVNLSLGLASTNVRFLNNRYRTRQAPNTILASNEEYVGTWTGNLDMATGLSEYAIQTANGLVSLVLKYNRHLVGGALDNTYSSVPSLKNAQYASPGQLCEIAAAGSNSNQNWAVIEASSSSHQLQTRRFLNSRVVLTVVKDNVSGKWQEKSYCLRSNGRTPRANDLEIPASPLVGFAPTIQAYGCTQISLASGIYSDWAEFPRDIPIRIVLTANAALIASATLGVSSTFAGAGEIWLILPVGSTRALELYRVVY